MAIRNLVSCLVCVLLVGSSCEESANKYKIFIAGHAYGNPNDKRAGFHPPFAEYTKKANADRRMELGFLTGDFIKNYEFEAFPLAVQDGIKLFDFPVYTCAGNHELFGDYKKYFGDFYYYKKYKGDLYIVLTPGLDNWNISGDQLSFLKETLHNEADQSRHVIILMHELIWWSPTNQYKEVAINYAPYFPGETNFDSVVKPLLQSYKRPFILIAGDLGATPTVSPVMYSQEDNLTLIGSGMGSWEHDHVLELTLSDRKVKYDIIPIGSGKNLGSLEDHSF